MFTDPTECSCHGDKLIKGECHKCNTYKMFYACITANVKAGKMSLAVQQLRLIGF